MTSRRGVWILLATILGSSMVFIDSNVVNIALPTIQVELNTTTASVQWVVEAYALFLGALILVGGSLGDIYGRRRIFALGVCVFALASIGCGISTSITQLIIARAIQGLGGALLTPGSLAIIRASFDEQRRGRAIGLWSGFSAITSALGPVIGGWLVQNTSWRWIFFINIPLAILVLVILFLRVPESKNAQQAGAHVDFVGAILATIGLGGLVFGLIESNSRGLTDPLVLACTFIGIVVLGIFIWVERRSRAPMMPLVLFRSRTFSGTNLLTLFLYAALGGGLFFLPFNLINVQGYSATAAGASLLPFTLLMFSLSRWSGGLITRFGARLPLIIGPLFAALGFVLFALPGTGGSYWLTFFPAIIMLGLGMTITVPTLTTTVMGVVEERYAGIASAINNAVARIAGLLAIAVLGIFMLATFNIVLDNHLTTLHVSPAVHQFFAAQRGKLVGVEIPSGVSGSLHTALEQSLANSFVAGFRVIMLISAGFALAASLCAFFTVAKPEQITPASEEHQCADNASMLTCVRQASGKLPAVTDKANVPTTSSL